MGYSVFADYEGLTDFSATANPQGFSAITINLAYYSRMGNLVHCIVRFTGTSNATTLTFTLPYATANESGGTVLHQVLSAQIVDNGSTQAGPGKLTLSNNSTTATATKDGNATAWTNANSKTFICEFFYRKA